MRDSRRKARAVLFLKCSESSRQGGAETYEVGGACVSGCGGCTSDMSSAKHAKEAPISLFGQVIKSHSLCLFVSVPKCGREFFC